MVTVHVNWLASSRLRMSSWPSNAIRPLICQQHTHHHKKVSKDSAIITTHGKLSSKKTFDNYPTLPGSAVRLPAKHANHDRVGFFVLLFLDLSFSDFSFSDLLFSDWSFSDLTLIGLIAFLIAFVPPATSLCVLPVAPARVGGGGGLPCVCILPCVCVCACVLAARCTSSGGWVKICAPTRWGESRERLVQKFSQVSSIIGVFSILTKCLVYWQSIEYIDEVFSLLSSELAFEKFYLWRWSGGGTTHEGIFCCLLFECTCVWGREGRGGGKFGVVVTVAVRVDLWMCVCRCSSGPVDVCVSLFEWTCGCVCVRACARARAPARACVTLLA